MKSGWVTKKLGDVCEINYGTRVRRKDSRSDNYPVYGGGGETFRWETFNRENQCVVSRFAMSPECVRFVPGKFFLNDSGLTVDTASDGLLQDYLDWCLFGKQDIIYALGKGSAQKNLDIREFVNIPIPIPPLPEQKRIVAKIDVAFEKIDKLKANAEKNLANAKELFQAALDEAMRPKDGWVEKRLGEVCAITSVMVDPTLPQFTNMLHIGGGNIVSQTGELVDLKTAKEENLRSGKFTFDKSMVLYNKIRPYLKKVARPNFSGLCSADMYPLCPNSCCIRDFLYYMLLTNRFTKYAIGESERAGMPKVNREELFAYCEKIPDKLSEQREIVKRLDLLAEKIKMLEQNYTQQIADCVEMRQAVLREAFEGRL
ncbi:MAG: restriction endonuclease subunit S [Lentisphaerae bacterium]|nr:restriction endonuclease subunit S [Lentisphaerota bacterium]